VCNAADPLAEPEPRYFKMLSEMIVDALVNSDFEMTAAFSINPFCAQSLASREDFC